MFIPPPSQRGSFGSKVKPFQQQFSTHMFLYVTHLNQIPLFQSKPKHFFNLSRKTPSISLIITQQSDFSRFNCLLKTILNFINLLLTKRNLSLSKKQMAMLRIKKIKKNPHRELFFRCIIDSI